MENISFQKYVKLRNGVEMPLVGLGTFPLKGQELKETLRTALRLGYRNFDTAHKYGNEADIGNFFAENGIERKSLFITSKYELAQFVGKKWWIFNYGKEGFKKGYLNSCKRLQTDYLDLYMIHSPCKHYLEFYGELIKLHEAGKVRSIGMANCNVERLEEIKKEHGTLPMVNQIELHPFCQQRETVEYCKINHVVVEAYSPFAHGAIMQDLLNNQILKRIADDHGKTITQIILRWIVQQGIVALPRSSNPKHIKENVSVFDFSLTNEEMSQIYALDMKKGYSKFAHHNPNQYSSIGD
mgnify:CR=1 FL=1